MQEDRYHFSIIYCVWKCCRASWYKETVWVREDGLYNLLAQKCDRIRQSKHGFTFDIFQIHPKHKFSLQILTTDTKTENWWIHQMLQCGYLYSPHCFHLLQIAFVPCLSSRIQLSCSTLPALKTQSCCFQPVSFTTERKVIEFCLLYRGSLGWIKI